MQNRDTAILEALVAIQSFLNDQKKPLGDLAESAPRKVLDNILSELRTQAIEQQVGQVIARGETLRQAQLRQQLRRRHLRPIAAVANIVLPQVRGLRIWAVPSMKISSVDLIAAANATATAAKAREAAFIAGGLRPGFVDRLQAATAALENSLNVREINAGRSQHATRALGILRRRGLLMIHLVDALIAEKCEFDDDLLDEWRRVKAVGRKRRPAESRTTPAIPAVSGTAAA